MQQQCTHLDRIRDVEPSAQGCEECLQMDDTWVHLRECLECGHVGCCDSSKNRHATKHFHDTEHPKSVLSSRARTGAGATWTRLSSSSVSIVPAGSTQTGKRSMRTNSSSPVALIGKGLLAGLVGTAAMTASSTLEMKLRDREASNAPADAAAKVLGMDFEDEESKARFGNLVHWGYGAGWGAVRGLIGAAGLEGVPAALAHFGVVLGAEQVMLPALEVAPPIWEWGAEEVAVDIFHHVVYTAATDLSYIYLKG